ncbi:MAG TPA: ABC transporter ATP-binding protein [Acidimicrobiales bacterium]|nr:ABC transporter ATP-binding protein [Acidimicrobiales bacterium]
MPPILDVHDLSTHIKLSRSTVQAVGNVSFSIGPGETLGLVGESGCGKSMTGYSIMRLLPNGGHIVGGSIDVDGVDIVKLSEREMRDVRGNEVAMIFQDSLTSLNPTMTVGRQIAEQVRRHRHVSKQAAMDRAAEMLGIVGFPRPAERLGNYPHQMSGGQRQRVMIAIALSCDPKLLIADEPTTALDVTIQAQILGLLDDLKERLGMAVLLVTHDMGVVAGRADRVNVMYAGRIVETATTRELFAHMHHPYTQALLGSIPLLTQDREQRLYSIPGLPPDLTNPPPGCRFAPRCARATERCHNEEPMLEPAGGEHYFASWHPVDGPIVRTRDGGGASAAPIRDKSALAGATDVRVSGNGVAPTSADGGAAAPAAAEREWVAAADDADLLVIDDVVREYPVTSGMILQRKVNSVKAVSGVSFTVGRAETFGLVGESGCGKTTLGKVIVGLEKADRGRVTLHGHDITKMRQHELRRFRRDLQMMFQDPIASLDPRMRVGAVLREPMRIQGVGSKREQDQVIAELLHEVGLPPNAVERFPHEFSGGQRQRIGLARALTLNPQVIVADEPVSALDVSIRSQVLNLMKRLQQTHGLTYVVISHDLAVVKYLSDRIGVMYLGKLVEMGSGEDIYRHPVHHYTAGLIATVPVPDPSVERQKGNVGIKGELPSPVDPPSGCRFRTRCPAAQDICAEAEPPLRLFGPGHIAACHFPLEEPIEGADPMAGASVGAGPANGAGTGS